MISRNLITISRECDAYRLVRRTKRDFMSVIEIEKYRGFPVLFDTNSAKFYSIISDVNSKESASFLSVKKHIDDFKKENQAFAPFWIIPNPGRGYKSERILVYGIRKDGRFVGNTDKKEVLQISEYDEDSYILEKTEQEPILSKLKEINDKMKEHDLHCRALKKDLLDSVNLTTLREFKKSELSI